MKSVSLLCARFCEEDRSLWLARANSLLSAAERTFVAEVSDLDVATQHAVGRAIIRLIGAEASGREPQELKVTVSAAGKPALADLPHLQVSVSHTASVVVVAACSEIPVGVDVEGDRAATTDARRLARRLFSEREAETLERVPDGDVDAWFISAWTIKEAVGKAVGLGVAPALAGAVVESCGAELRLAHVWCGPDAHSWSLHQLRAPNGSERIAVALPAPNVKLQTVRELTLAALG